MNELERPPTVSALMIARNRAATLPAAVSSIQEQEGVSWELLIVDDASSDDTVAIAQRLAARDNRIKVLSNDGPPGIPGARNSGVAAARGRFLAICDSDDLSRPGRFVEQAVALDADGGMGGVGAQINAFRAEPADGRVPDWRWGLRGGRGPFAFPSAMLRLDAVRQVGGFDNRFLVVEDLDLFYRMAAIGWRFATLDRVLVDYRFDGDGSMSTHPRGAALTLRAQLRGLRGLRGGFSPQGYATVVQTMGRAAREALRRRPPRISSR